MKAPVQRLIVMGSRASGKSTLIRQLKSAHDTIDVEEASRFAREARKVALELVLDSSMNRFSFSSTNELDFLL